MNTKIIINPDGSSHLEGLKKTDDCYKILEWAKSAGTVVEDKPKDHTPVHQTVNTKGV